MKNRVDKFDVAWVAGFSLNDRARCLNRKRATTDLKETEKRLYQRWLDHTSFADEHVLNARLQAAGLTSDEFLSLFAQSDERSTELLQDVPAWVISLESAYADPAGDFPETLSKLSLHPFIQIFTNFLAYYVDQLRDSINAAIAMNPDLAIDIPAIEASLLKAISYKIIWLASKPLILELNCMRVEGTLAGETPSERFNDFIEQMKKPERSRAFLTEYPILARRLIALLDNWLSFSRQIVTCLGNDWSEIRQAFFSDANPKLLDIASDMGDSHCRGRAVAILSFDAGHKIVFKPRPLDIDSRFAVLLAQLNALCASPELRSPMVLARERYGWAEFIDNKGCNSDAQLLEFYERQGSLLALLYALEGTDFHSENLIASGDTPVLVDLEALFHPRLPPDEEGAIDEKLPGYDVLENSVFRVGFLPQRIWANKESEGIDLSGLGTAEGQISPHKVSVFENDLTDELKITSKQILLPAGKNRPTLKGSSVHLPDYLAPLLAGFTNMYRILMDNRNRLVMDGGMLDAFSDCEIRVVIRATRVYGLLLGNSMHPDASRDGLWHERAFHLLWKRAFHKSRYIPLIASELDDLWENDIPLFRAQVGSTDLYDSRRRVFPGFLQESALSRVKSRINSLTDDDLSRQLNLIHNSIATLDIARGKWWGSKYSLELSESLDDPQPLFQQAEAIAHRLKTTAIISAEKINWLGLQLIDERYWAFKPLEADLYSGIPGIAFFFAYLGEMGSIDSHKATARSLIDSCIAATERILNKKTEMISVGAFSGIGGMIYVLAHLSWLWKDEALANVTYSIMERGAQDAKRQTSIDVIGGLAGWLLSIVSASCLPSLQPLPHGLNIEHLISETAERICDLAIPMARGVAWAPSGEAYRPLTGFSHGNSGVAFSLVRAWMITGNNRYKDVAEAAIEYERSVFSAETENWPDYRRQDGTDFVPDEAAYQVDWCHGAPGIGLARTRWINPSDPLIAEEIRVATHTTLRYGFGRNHSLCHGDLGNAELLLYRHPDLTGSNTPSVTGAVKQMIIHSIKTHGFLCGTPQHIETPGLMTGLAGIGYGLLRLAAPDRIPILLLLDGPIQHPR